MAFPVHRDHDAYCLIKTRLYNSKTFLRRKELRTEKKKLWYDTKFSICTKGVYLFIWILCVLVRWRAMSGVSPQRDLPLSPAQKRQAKNSAKRHTHWSICSWALSSPIPRHVWEWDLSHSVYVLCYTLTRTHSIHKISSIECKCQVYTAVSIHTGLVLGVTQTIDSH